MTSKKSGDENSRKSSATGAGKTASSGAKDKQPAGKKVSKKKVASRRSDPVGQAKSTEGMNKNSKTEMLANPEQAHTSEPYTANSGGKFMLAASLLALVLSVYAVYEVTLGNRMANVELAGFGDRLGSSVAEQKGLKLAFDGQKTQNEQQMVQIGSNLSELQTSVDGLQRAADKSIDDIKADLGESVARWKLDEIHSLLTRVSRAYQLTGDPAQALAGLELAQSSLASMDNPRLVAVNSALSEDILNLESVRSVDIAALNNQLAGIGSRIPDLVLAEDARTANAEASEAQVNEEAPAADEGILAAGKALFSDIGSLVKHKNLETPLQPTLDEQARFVVYESLGLEVQAATIALLRRDNASYQQHLKATAESLGKYFDVEQETAKMIRDQLQVLESYDISQNAQAISGALSALNRVMVMESKP